MDQRLIANLLVQSVSAEDERDIIRKKLVDAAPSHEKPNVGALYTGIVNTGHAHELPNHFGAFAIFCGNRNPEHPMLAPEIEWYHLEAVRDQLSR
jgi:hypothetical protein